jgi:hypothetical protein
MEILLNLGMSAITLIMVVWLWDSYKLAGP